VQDIEGIVAVRRDLLDWDYTEQIAIDLGAVVDMDLITQLRAIKERQT
jgi:hypothetical protein